MRNSNDGNNHNKILYVVVNYITIKYPDLNVMSLLFLLAFIYVYSHFTVVFMFILLKIIFCPNIRNGVKY